MGFVQMPLLSALAEKMRWHQTRQSLLAENVANAETPGYRGKDLKAFDFAQQLKSVSMAQVATVATNPSHFVAQSRSDGGFASEPEGFEEYRTIGKAVLAGDAKRAEASGRAHVRRIANNLEHLPDNAFDLPAEPK